MKHSASINTRDVVGRVQILEGMKYCLHFKNFCQSSLISKFVHGEVC